MASVEKNGKKWRIRDRDASGKKYTVGTFDTESEAIVAAGAEKSNLPGWTLIKPPDFGKATRRRTPTVVDFARDLLDDPALRPNTRDMYAAALRRIGREPLGEMPLGEITPAAVREFFRSIERNRTNVQAVLAKVFNAAVREGIIKVSPLTQANIRPPKRGQKKLRVLTAPEVEKLAAAALHERDRLTILLGAYCGLRAGEVGGLRVEDVDVADCRIHVRRNAVKTAHTIEFGEPKTEASVRSLKIACSLAEEVARYVEANPPLADGTIFHTVQGNPVTESSLTWMIARASQRASLQRVTFHDLRHTCASLLIAAKHEPKAIQRYLGHSSIRMTYDVYGHLFPEADDALAAGMEALRKGA